MFKNLLPLLFAVVLLFSSCSNDDFAQNFNEESLSLAKTSNVLDLTGNAQKLAFSFLMLPKNTLFGIIVWKR